MGVEEWSGEMKAFAGVNLAFVKMVEETFGSYITSGKASLILPQSEFIAYHHYFTSRTLITRNQGIHADLVRLVPQAKRTFVMSLAETYRLTRELIDQEPKRSIQIRRE
jgi:transcriptional repressor NF-X1